MFYPLVAMKNKTFVFTGGNGLFDGVDGYGHPAAFMV
jgi:hypothetical protein